MVIKVLNVAEKPSVARALASVFSQEPQSRDGPPIRDQAAQIFVIDNVIFPNTRSQGSGTYIHNNNNNVPHKMIVTSVRGHLASQDFPPDYGWSACPPIVLFDAPIETTYKNGMDLLKRMLQSQAKTADVVILWLDCDREGEAICDEVRTVCLEAKPGLRDQIYRAKFSTVLPQEIKRALRSLGRVNDFFVQAVQARSEHDLRVGAAFTRFQTLRLQKSFEEFADGSMGVISYGPCQFPTLGFVVERWARIETFIPENYWYLEMSITVNADGSIEGLSLQNNDQSREQQNGTDNHQQNNTNCRGRKIGLRWQRERLYDRVMTMVLYESCLDAEEAEVVSLTGRQKNKWRPIPLATVELQKRASKYLRIGSEVLMTAAEELYQQGLISYPRTETEKFRPEFQHIPLIESFQGVGGVFGEYSSKLLRDNNFQNPRAGQNDDAAHPPITPCKAVDPDSIQNETQKNIYILIVKHYLACCSRDAIGKETVLKVKMASEEFTAKGLMILERNWLEIYAPFERWSQTQELPYVEIGSKIRPSSLLMRAGQTRPPQLISEVELISLMDRNGIGTDATIAQHITTIQDRAYAVKDQSQKFRPTKLGIALIEGYNSMGFMLNRPDLRREMEAECNAVAMGCKRKEEIMQPILAKMLQCFQRANAEAHKLDEAVARHYTRMGANDTNSSILRANFSICGGCSGMTTLKELSGGNQQGHGGNRRQNNNNRARTKLLYCTACSIGLRLPKGVPSAHTNSQMNNQPFSCPICHYQVIKISQGDGYNGNGYHLCPKCFNTAPNEYGGSATSGEFRCYNCTHTTCSLATGIKGGDIEIFPCPFCEAKSTNGKITLRQNSRGYILSCSNYTTTNRARCDYTIWLPKEASSVSVPESNNDVQQNGTNQVVCNHCSTENRVVRKLLFKWKPNSIPPGNPRELKACVLCDQTLKSDFGLKLPQMNQVLIRGRHGSGRSRSATRGSSRGRGGRNSSQSRERFFNNQARQHRGRGS